MSTPSVERSKTFRLTLQPKKQLSFNFNDLIPERKHSAAKVEENKTSWFQELGTINEDQQAHQYTFDSCESEQSQNDKKSAN